MISTSSADLMIVQWKCLIFKKGSWSIHLETSIEVVSLRLYWGSWNSNLCLDGVLSVAISFDGELLASGSRDQSIKIFTRKNQKNIVVKENYHSSTPLPELHYRLTCFILDFVRSLLFTKDSRYLISGSYDNTIKILDIDDAYNPPITIDAHTGIISIP